MSLGTDQREHGAWMSPDSRTNFWLLGLVTGGSERSAFLRLCLEGSGSGPEYLWADVQEELRVRVQAGEPRGV